MAKNNANPPDDHEAQGRSISRVPCSYLHIWTCHDMSTYFDHWRVSAARRQMSATVGGFFLRWSPSTEPIGSTWKSWFGDLGDLGDSVGPGARSWLFLVMAVGATAGLMANMSGFGTWDVYPLRLDVVSCFDTLRHI